MENNIKLATAFAFMACDGEIAPEEIALIKSMNEAGTISSDNIDSELNALVESLNRDGKAFLQGYLSRVKDAAPDAAEAMGILRIAVSTIYADSEVTYPEVKFFRAVRSRLHSLSDAEILAALPEIEDFWLESDLNAAPGSIDEDYFGTIVLPTFDLSNLLDTK